MKQKRINSTILLFGVFCTSMVYSQSTIEYSYDAAGNRIKRVAVVEPIESSTSDDQENSTKEEKVEYNFTLHPNPADDQILIEAEAAFMELNSKKYFVYNTQGALVEQGDFVNGQQTIHLPGDATGYYLVKVAAAGDYYADFRVLKK